MLLFACCRTLSGPGRRIPGGKVTASGPGTEAAIGARPVGDDSLHPTVVIIATVLVPCKSCGGSHVRVRYTADHCVVAGRPVGNLANRPRLRGAPMTIGWLTIAFFAGTFFGIFVIGMCQAAGQDTECPRMQRSSSANRSPHQAEDFRYSGESAGSRADVEAA